MVFTMDPILYKLNEKGEKTPSYDLMEGNLKDLDEAPKPVRFEVMNIFDLPLIVILKNIANTIMAIISELSMEKSYNSVYSFMKVFMIDNRLMYVGIIIVFLSLFIAFFFDE